MRVTWMRKNVAKVYIKGEGIAKKGVLDVRIDDKSVSFKRKGFPVFEGVFEKAHLLFKVFPSEIFVYDDLPFERHKSVEINGSYTVFFDKYQALAIYFSKSIKMYVDGMEKNHHVSTPAVDFYVSYAETPLEAVRSLRSVIKIPADTIGTYLDVSRIKPENRVEAIHSFEGDGIFVRKRDESLVSMVRNAGKNIVGTFPGVDVKVRRSWKIEKNCDRSGLIEKVVMSSLQKKLYASCDESSPVYLTGEWEISDRRKILESSMKDAYSRKLPPVAPVFFLHNKDKELWYVLDYFLVGDSILYIPSAFGRKFAQIYIPDGKYMEVFSKEILNEGVNCVTSPGLLLKENRAIWYMTGQKSYRIIVFKWGKSVRLKIGDRVITVKDSNLMISEGKEEMYIDLLVRSRNSIKEISISVDKSAKEVSI